MKSYHKNFIKGVEEKGYNYDEFIESFFYIGGDKGRHFDYFKLCNKEEKKYTKPIHNDYCICGHTIVENCYISDGTDILVIGNCCIKKFMKNSTRTCETCKTQHKNRKVNKCKDCQEYFKNLNLLVMDEEEKRIRIKYDRYYEINDIYRVYNFRFNEEMIKYIMELLDVNTYSVKWTNDYAIFIADNYIVNIYTLSSTQKSYKKLSEDQEFGLRKCFAYFKPLPF